MVNKTTGITWPVFRIRSFIGLFKQLDLSFKANTINLVLVTPKHYPIIYFYSEQELMSRGWFVKGVP